MKKFLLETIDALDMLKKHPKVKEYAHVGSAVYLENPADLDILVLAEGAGFMECEPPPSGDWFEESGHSPRWMFGSEWELCGGEYDDQDDKWGALRKGNINLIVTVDKGWYDRCKLASEVCAALELEDKGDRIVVHRVVRDGYSALAANARRDGSR